MYIVSLLSRGELLIKEIKYRMDQQQRKFFLSLVAGDVELVTRSSSNAVLAMQFLE